jgi:hypothetical protein
MKRLWKRPCVNGLGDKTFLLPGWNTCPC